MTLYQPPPESYVKLFLRFLRFGLLAWGGPVAQIAMLRQELVEDEKWIEPARFNRVLAVYQALPGPEAHELCVYFGLIARGRVGGLLAGLGFMLPGFLLMFALSWGYATFGLNSPLFAMAFYGCQPAVVALIVRATHRIGSHALTDRWLLGLAVLAALATGLGVHFLVTILSTGLVYAALKRQSSPHVTMPLALTLGPALLQTVSIALPSLLDLFGYGLRAGLLTFGGAYTAIPFLQYDAVVVGGWMTNAQFLDGLALSGLLPAPLIIFSTFVGYLGGGPLGALALTAGVFLPAFGFTLIGHEYVEKLVENRAAHAFLDGVTAGVVGLIAMTALTLSRDTLTDGPRIVIFALALLAAYRWKAKVAVAGIMVGAAVLGGVLFMFKN